MNNVEWLYFSRKMDMLIEELEAYNEIQDSYNNLENIYVNNIKKQADLKKKLQEVNQSTKSIFGTFSKITKADKINQLRAKLARTDGDIYAEERLIALISAVMINHEIPLIKLRKRMRFESIINEFAILRIRKCATERKFWRTIIDQNANKRDESMAISRTESELEHKSTPNINE
jgi:hypothetical protein